MNSKIIPSLIIAMVTTFVVITACTKDVAPPPPPVNHSWVEEFDTVENALTRGWAIVNNSRPIGTASWIQGEYGIGKKGLTGFPAQSVTYSGQDFAVVTFNAGDSLANLSAWLISPSSYMKNGDEIQFYSRTLESPANYPDRLQVRLNPNSNTVNVGNGRLSDMDVANRVGDFSQLLLDINPSLLTSGPTSYPAVWTKYSITISGLAEPGERRFAFRYFVPDGGPNGTNSQGVGVDSVAFISK